MRSAALATLCLLTAIASPALAAGGGAGSGGAGAQRAINSGLPPGEPGPAGSPNNRHPAKTSPPMPHHGSPRYEPVEGPSGR